MSVETFLAAVLPSQGHRFILATFGEQGQEDFRPVQRAYAPGQEADAIGTARWGSSKGANAYFATAGFMEPPLDPETGKPKGGRTADRALWFRCLRVDIDCGEGKPYGDKRTGLAALAEFCNRYSLPLPWLVDSGYGLHAYWTFDRDVATLEWLGYAQRLATACYAAQFHVDATVTLDAARVLRLPGTNNYKRGGCVPVLVVHQGETRSPEQLVHHLPAGDSLSIAGALPASMRGMAGELQQNLHTPYFLKGVLTQCPGMGAMVADGGARAAEPLWKLALDLIWKADDSDEVKWRVARGVSSGHADFSEEAFAAKWQQVQQQDYHPPTCKAMANAGLPECARCPFNGRISSPLTLGRPQAETVVPAAAIPIQPASPAAPTSPGPDPAVDPATLVPVTPQMGVFVMVDESTVHIADGKVNDFLRIYRGLPNRNHGKKQEDGTLSQEWHIIMPYKILAVERLLDTVGQKSITAITFDRGLDRTIRIEFPHTELTDAKAFHATLSAHGMYLTRKSAIEMMDEFMPEFLSQLQRARAANQIASRCGWTEDRKGFVLGTTLYTLNNAEHVRPGSVPEEMLAFRSQGNEAEWMYAMDLVLSGGADRQAVAALAIASPLMVYTGLYGVMLNAHSHESGVGKSTLGDAALSIWGSPDGLRKSARDTANATWRLAGVLGNMPMVIDEFTNVEGRALSDFAYTVTQGREKHRMNASSQLQSGGGARWCLAVITTANSSVHDKLLAYKQDALAEAARVFDLRLGPLPFDPVTLGAAKTHLQALTRSYGFLGPRIVQLLLSRPESYWRELVAAKISKWDQKVATSASDRFRSATAALIEIGAALGAALGLRFDVPAVCAVVEREWRRQIDVFESERRKPIDFVKGYMDENIGDFLTVGGIHGDVALGVTRKYRGEIRGRTVDGRFRPISVTIPQDQLRQYVRDKNGNYDAFVEWLRNEVHGGVVTRMGKLSYLAGTHHQYTTQAVEFSAAVLHDGAVMKVVPTTPSVPDAPARATK